MQKQNNTKVPREKADNMQTKAAKLQALISSRRIGKSWVAYRTRPSEKRLACWPNFDLAAPQTNSLRYSRSFAQRKPDVIQRSWAWKKLR